MSRTARVVPIAMILAVAAIVHGAAAQSTKREPAGARYEKASDWPQLPPGMKLGFVVNMIPQRDGTMWILQRSNPPILHVDGRGRLLASFGDGLFAQTHGMCMTRDGSLWVGDSGQPFPPPGPRAGAVFHKFSQKGERLMTIGRPGVSAIGRDTFVAPTACIEAPNGDIIIADGHIPRADHQDTGDRLIRFSRTGEFIRSYGETGKGPGQFRGIHQLAYDSKGRLFVADGRNSRLQIFARDMSFVAEWTAFGRPSMLFITGDDTLLTLDTESGTKANWTDWPGDDPKAARNPKFSVGVRIGSARTGVVTHHFNPDPEVPSDMLAVDREGSLYTRGAKWIKKKE